MWRTCTRRVHPAAPPCTRVQILDDDDSGDIQWHEFVNAVNALETGAARDKLRFCFRVYDGDDSGAIDRDELLAMFSSMLLGGGQAKTEATPALQELIDDFVDTIYDSFDQVRVARAPSCPRACSCAWPYGPRPWSRAFGTRARPPI